VSVDAGFTCPNRDGTAGLGGCSYCDNDSFRPATADRSLPLAEQIARGAAFLRTRYRAEKFIVYFQPFSNTYAPLDVLVPLYEEALSQADVVGLAVGTRADCVDEEKLRWFEQAARRRFVAIEYGLESIHDATLRRINRGHNFRCVADAMRRSAGRGIHLCAHLILGFPWETRQEMLETARTVSGFGIQSVKLHHLHVLSQTALGREFTLRPFALPSLREYAELAVDFLEWLSPGILIERLSAAVPESRLLAPVWGKRGGEVQRAIQDLLEARQTYQGRLLQGSAGANQSERRLRDRG